MRKEKKANKKKKKKKNNKKSLKKSLKTKAMAEKPNAYSLKNIQYP